MDALLRDEEVLQQSVTVSEAEVTRLQEETDKLEKDCISKRQALELVPSASENIIRLQEVCDKSAQKLRLLEEEWDSVQAPMIEELGLKERQKAAVSPLARPFSSLCALLIPACSAWRACLRCLRRWTSTASSCSQWSPI